MTRIVERLNAGLHSAFEKDERVYLLGEDLLDPYGGAFKVSKGLSSQYPERVFTSPVSEAAIVGVAGGMALRGLRPVVEIMFGDFTTLIADQLINSLSKFGWMYNEQVQVPVVIRTPMGGRRGYGPTHSQTLEKLFLGTPGLRVLAVNALQDPAEMIEGAILKGDRPTLLIENKLLYAKELLDESALADFDVQRAEGQDGIAAEFLLKYKQAPTPRYTLAAYGFMAELAREALHKLAFEEELFGEMYVTGQLWPLPEGGLSPLLMDSAKRTGALLTLEEGGLSYGWGAEIISRASEAGTGLRMGRVGAKDQVIPASIDLETKVLPGVEEIMAAIRKMV